MIKKYLETGKIVGTHGVRGMVRIQPWADSGEFLTRFKKLYLDENGENSVTVLKAQPHGGVVIASFKNTETIEQAEKLRGKTVYIDREDTCLPEGRYFVEDIIGCTAYDADSEKEYGTVTDVSVTGANDVWHITKNNKEYLIPAIGEVIVSAEPENGRVIIRPMKGIFDDED